MAVKLFKESMQVTFTAPSDLGRRMKEDAARGDRNMSAQMRMILREYYRMVDTLPAATTAAGGIRAAV